MPSDRVSGAGLLVAAALFVHALPWPGPDPRPCARPGERESWSGHSFDVDCDSEEFRVRPVRGPARRLFGLPIDINRADAATLASLPGIGPARASAILAARAQRPFAGVEDLERVSGIGPVLLERLRDFVTARPLAPAVGSR